MICVVIGDQERFAENCLAVVVRDFREEISRLSGDKICHLFQVTTELLYGLIPELCVSDLVRIGPIAFGKIWLYVVRIATEFQNVRLRDAHMFEHLPGSVRQALDHLPA